MYVTIDRGLFLQRLAMVANVVPNRSPRECLKNVAITAKGDRVTLFATDCESRIETSCEADVDEEGQCLAPKSILVPALRDSDAEFATIEDNDPGIRLTCNGATYHLQTPSIDEYPNKAIQPEGCCMTIDFEQLKLALARTIFCTDSDSTRYSLGGVCLDTQETPSAVGTDSWRLAVCDLPVSMSDQQRNEWGQVIISKSSVNLILKAKCEGEVQLWSGDKSIVLIGDDFRIASLTVDGKYPAWRKVLPDQNQVESEFHHCSANANNFLQRVRQAKATQDKESRAIDLTFGKDSVSMTCQSSDVGRSLVNLPCKYDGPEFSSRVDLGFLLDMSAFPSDEDLNIYVKDAVSHVLFSVTGYRYVIMPMAKQ